MRFIELKDEGEVSGVIRDLPESVALDCETDSKEPRKARLLSVSIAAGDTAYIIPAELLQELSPLKSRHLILQNFKYDFQVLYRHGLDLTNCTFHDTMLMHHIMDENSEHGLDSMVQAYFKDNYKEAFWKQYKTFEEAPKEVQLEYQGKDAIYTYKLHQFYSKYLDDKRDLVLHVHRLARSLYLTEVYGVRVNLPLMQDTKVSMQAEIESYLPKLREQFFDNCQVWELSKWSSEIDKRKSLKGKLNVPKPRFSFSSDPQISWLLYQSLKLPVLTKTKKGNPSTDYETLVELEKTHPSVELLRRYKGAKTLFSTFVEGMLGKVEGDRIYPEFNVNGTHTGRISHKNPNLGNIPKEGVIRNFFIPDEGRKLGGADFSQLEVVIEANFSRDKNLIKIIKDGASKHDITAQEMKISRDHAKTLNFAMQYRCSPYKVAKLLDCSAEEATYHWNKYWEVYAGVKALMDHVDGLLDSGQPIVNPFGRARHFPDSFANKYEHERAKRQAYNALIQGTGADITHRAFYLMSERLVSNRHGRMLWEVHDELLAEIDAKYFAEEIEILVNIMESVGRELKFDIPLKAKAYGPLDCWVKT
jgi:DNA polymerase I